MATFLPPMLPNEVKCIAKSIGGWVWTHFTPQNKAAWHAAQNRRRKTTTNAGRRKSSHQVSFKMSYPKNQNYKTRCNSKELAERFNCSTRTVFRAWSQSRTDYLNETASAKTNHGNNSEYLVQLGHRRGKPSTPKD